MNRRKTTTSNNGYNIFVNHDGDVFSLGDGQYGGNGHKGKTVLSPTIIPTLKHIVSVSVGNNHTVCLGNDGRVFFFGKRMFFLRCRALREPRGPWAQGQKTLIT